LIVSFALIVLIKHVASLSALAVATGIYCIFRGLRLLVRKRRQSAPASRIASSLPGLVEVHGIATGPNTISVPITGQPCYLYRTTVWQQRKTANHEWEIAEETLHVPFFLDDSTGQLLIEPIGAELDLQSEFHKEYDPVTFLEPNKAPSPVSMFLARHGVVTPARRIRIEERCIQFESIVFIAGTVTDNPGIEVRTVSHGTLPCLDAPEVIRLSVSTEALTIDAMTQRSKITAALVKAGIGKPDAWAAAGVPHPEADTENRKATGPLPNEDRGTKSREPQADPPFTPALVLMKGPEDAPFVISWRSQRERGRAYIWQSALMLCGGTVLTLAGLHLFLLKTHLL
jgi:hypothetical protein